MKKTILTKEELYKIFSDNPTGLLIRNTKVQINPNTWKAMQIRGYQKIFNHENEKIRNCLDISNIKNLTEFFQNHNFIKKPININIWDIHNIRSLSQTFHYSIFSNDIDISTWITKNVIYLTMTFKNIPTLKQNFNTWDIRKVETTYGCFKNITNPQYQIEQWKPHKNTEMIEMFQNSNQNINFNLWEFKYKKNGIIKNIKNMFENCKKQTNTLRTWKFKYFINLEESIKNTPKFIINTPNFYKMEITTEYINFLIRQCNKKNIYHYINKYMSKKKKQQILYYIKCNKEIIPQNLKSYTKFINTIKKDIT